MARAAVAPPKPPPITTTRGAAWASAGAVTPATAAAPVAARNCRRLTPNSAMSVSRSLLGRIPLRDRLDFRVGEAFGNPPHDRGWALPALEGLHLASELGSAAAPQPGDGSDQRGVKRMTPGTGAGTRRRFSPSRRTGQQQHRCEDKDPHSTPAGLPTRRRSSSNWRRGLLLAGPD